MSRSARTNVNYLYKHKKIKLPPEVNRIIYVRNLPYKITPEELYDIFSKYGQIRQIRKGIAGDKKGTAFVIYEDIYDAKNAVDHLQGFCVLGRYLVVLYYQPNRIQQNAKNSEDQKKIELLKIKQKYGLL